jgi:DNA-binding MarR family transcriptional regulator
MHSALSREDVKGMSAKRVEQKNRKKRVLEVVNPTAREWTFFTNHAHVLFILAMNQDLILREIADKVGITERGVQRIVADLSDAGFVERVKVGRRNEYRLELDQSLRHPIEQHRTIGDIIKVLTKSAKSGQLS